LLFGDEVAGKLLFAYLLIYGLGTFPPIVKEVIAKPHTISLYFSQVIYKNNFSYHNLLFF
jgi:hypothetical protein